jgi:hypothetical protein
LSYADDFLIFLKTYVADRLRAYVREKEPESLNRLAITLIELDFSRGTLID